MRWNDLARIGRDAAVSLDRPREKEDNNKKQKNMASPKRIVL